MKSGRYRFDLLCRHSNELSLSARQLFKQEFVGVKSGFDFLDQHFGRLESQPISHIRNVKMALTARFTNHLFSYVLLVERGLLLDAANCVRSATETLAFYWLVCKDSSTAVLYDAQESPRPVEIRKRLEILAVDVKELRDQYSFESAVAHVGNKYDNLQIDWEHEKTGKLLIGGGGNVNLRREMLRSVGRYIALFAKHDSSYIVSVDERSYSVKSKIDGEAVS